MSDPARFDDLMQAAWLRNRSKLLARLDRVRSLISATPPAPPEDERALRSDLHALVGALGTYGFPDGSQLLARIQVEVVHGRPAHGFGDELDRLRRQLESSG